VGRPTISPFIDAHGCGGSSSSSSGGGRRRQSVGAGVEEIAHARTHARTPVASRSPSLQLN